MVDEVKIARQLLYGTQRHFLDLPVRAQRARETILRVRPWLKGRIGRVETDVFRELIFAADHTLSAGQLARAVYCNEHWTHLGKWREKDDPPTILRSWMYHRVRLAARVFADPVAGGRGRKGIVWRL